MRRFLLPALAVMGTLFAAVASSAQTYTLHPRMTMVPVVEGPSGYLAALNNGSGPLVLEVVEFGNGLAALRHTASGAYLRAGYTEWNYLDLHSGGVDQRALFEITETGQDVLLRSAFNGLYVGFNAQSGRLRAAFDQADAHSVWRLQATAPRDDHVGNWDLHAARNAQGQWLSPKAGAPVRIELNLTGHGELVFSDGCALRMLRYTVSGSGLSVQGLTGRDHACSGNGADLGNAAFDAIYDVRSYHIDAVGQLNLFNARGQPIAVFGRR
ncbi:META domain-containing protein [Nioella aestuarii]|uniref:META domain-containing protein n=1 Tax=Nioella aestuarii TaxID=1662864 RepID=UPI003D7F98EB